MEKRKMQRGKDLRKDREQVELVEVLPISPHSVLFQNILFKKISFSQMHKYN